MTHGATRRTVLIAAGATGAAALTAGCGGGGDDGGSSTETPGGDTGTRTATGEETSAPDAPAGEQLASTSDIPVGGGTIFRDRKVVVTQPERGDFKAFSAICTHQNCLVANVSGGTINCSCHGSRFSVADGAVEHGPATRPLPEERITVDGNSIRLA
ncbi:Rieske (2Fe-2S) protein [Streptomyces sp. SBST2-5]|uniref:Cytochrome bc1 complex Rieske iron-sulfur subunit n=1 Tax=Streptomyces composti TaxID=2720025 RepID=A0ABX1ACA8_9ACTN|nr:Rieske (2Fe-2S) protein [Streptomyces composti]NJP52552.1 Rieske (2Fe-2S) protein [Streptomyces composti]